MRKRLQKASAAIHMSHNITLLQQNILNFLLFSAYKDFETKREFKISIVDILEYLDNRSRDTKSVKKALKGLCVHTRFNLFGKDKDLRWGYINILESVKITGGLCTYKFGFIFRNRFRDTDVYSYIDLNKTKKFKSKYGLFLYELAVDYKRERATDWIDIKTFRKYMGLKRNTYKTFKLLNHHVIKRAVDQVNEIADFEVAVIFKRSMKQVVSIRFFIARGKKV